MATDLTSPSGAYRFLRQRRGVDLQFLRLFTLRLGSGAPTAGALPHSQKNKKIFKIKKIFFKKTYLTFTFTKIKKFQKKISVQKITII